MRNRITIINFRQADIGLSILDAGQLVMFVISESVIIVSSVALHVLLRKTNPAATIRFKYVKILLRGIHVQNNLFSVDVLLLIRIFRFVEKVVEVLDTFFDITKLTIFGIIMACVYKASTA